MKTTFIPKAASGTTTSTQVSAAKQVGQMGVLSALATLFLIASIVGGGLLYVYSIYLDKQIAGSLRDIELSQNSLDPQFLDSITLLDQRLDTARVLLDTHRVTARVFEEIAKVTLKSVQFDSFSFDSSTPTFNATQSSDSVLEVSINGRATSYQAIAQQSDTFATIPMFASHLFSDFELRTDGTVTFLLNIRIPFNVLTPILETNIASEYESDGPLPVISTPNAIPTETATTAILDPLLVDFGIGTSSSVVPIMPPSGIPQ